MATAIRQRIALDGSDDVKRQLQAIGQTGDAAFRQVKDAADAVSQASGAAGEGALSFGEKLFGLVAITATVATAVVKLGRAFLASASDAAKAASDIANAATRSGQGLQAYQKQVFALEQTGLKHSEATEAVKKFGAEAVKAYLASEQKLKDLGFRFAPTEEGQQSLNDKIQGMGRILDATSGSVDKQKDVLFQLQKVVNATGAAFNRETGAVNQSPEVWQRLAEEIKSIQDPLIRSQVLTKMFGEELGRLINEKVVRGGPALKQAAEDFTRFGLGVTEEQKKIASEFEAAVGRMNAVRDNANRTSGLTLAAQIIPLINQFTEIIVAANAAIDRLLALAFKPLEGTFGEAIKAEAQKVFDAFSSVFAAIAAEVPNVFGAIGQTIGAIFSGIWDGVAAGASSMWEQIKNDAQRVVDFIVGLWERVKQAISSVPSANNTPGAPLGDVPGNAGGGVIRGRGTGTSDSILSWLSNGEYVVRAAAVRRYGLGFLSALNGMRLPRFNTGGIVDALQSSMAIPRFANGGLAVSPSGGGLHPVPIHFNGRQVGQLLGSMGAIEEIKRASVEQQLTSAGRKPSWVKS